MICSYYTKGQDNHELFDNFKIASDPSYKKHLNKYHTIFINITKELNNSSRDVNKMISRITSYILDDLKTLASDITYKEPDILNVCLDTFYQKKQESFVIVIDE